MKIIKQFFPYHLLLFLIYLLLKSILILDKLNDFCKDKNKNKIKVNSSKNCSEDIDVEDKCFRFSFDTSDEFLDIEKQKSIKNHMYIVNNIFNNIFEK